MKVLTCGSKTMVVEMSLEEFQRLTGNRVADNSRYCAPDLSPSEVEGVEVDLTRAMDHAYNLQLAAETKARIMDDLATISKRVEGAMWPLEIIPRDKIKIVKLKEVAR